MDLIGWLQKYEPVWLFVVLLIEAVYTILTYRMSKIEFDYDKAWNERKAARRKRQFNFDELNQGEGK